jgi:hypothetical protein
MVRALALLAVAAACCGSVAGAAAGASSPRPVKQPLTGGVPWPAPKDPIHLARAAGLKPEPHETLQHHVHSHLDVFVNGKHVTVPAGIGIDIHDPGINSGPMPDHSIAYGGANCKDDCISPLHTHADYGLLHTESPTPVPNNLGEFFVEWGVRLDSTCVGGYCKPDDSVLIYVNGKRYTKDPRKILLLNHTEIAIVIGSLPKKIPSTFPNVPL